MKKLLVIYLSIYLSIYTPVLYVDGGLVVVDVGDFDGDERRRFLGHQTIVLNNYKF